jgi:hypothetical protein
MTPVLTGEPAVIVGALLAALNAIQVAGLAPHEQVRPGQEDNA